jgi:hypothetical protein
LLNDFLGAALCIVSVARIAGKLLRFVGDLGLFVLQALCLLLRLGQAIFEGTPLALIQQTLRAVQLFLCVLRSLRLLLGIPALRLLLHVLSGLL